jgi:tetratricopeptide (TPR) repeat protein
MSSRRLGIVLSLLFLLPTICFACLWDTDTLAQERARFPSTLELITGKFYRHSDAYYRWRIEDRSKKRIVEPTNNAVLDDLAVAHAKLKQFDQAIAIANEQLGRNPKRYETLSNLGTFYILSGKLKQGLPYIDRALEVNPDAHFGREKYQKWLVEYALSKYPDEKIKFPLEPRSETSSEFQPVGFAAFLLQKEPGTDSRTAWRQKVITAVLGMMRFADHDNPLLLEALGDCLGESGDQSDGKRLAARAYLCASQKMVDVAAHNCLRTNARIILKLQQQRDGDDTLVTLEQLESDFANEVKDAEDWYEQYVATEKGWIDSGVDIEAKYLELLLQEQQLQVQAEPYTLISYLLDHPVLLITFLISILISILLASILLLRRFIRFVARQRQH